MNAINAIVGIKNIQNQSYGRTHASRRNWRYANVMIGAITTNPPLIFVAAAAPQKIKARKKYALLLLRIKAIENAVADMKNKPTGTSGNILADICI